MDTMNENPPPPHPRPTPGFGTATGPERAGFRFRLQDASGTLWEDTDRDRLAEHIEERSTRRERRVLPPANFR